MQNTFMIKNKLIKFLNYFLRVRLSETNENMRHLMSLIEKKLFKS